MASKSWSLLYTLARVENAVEHALNHLTGSASSSFPTALKAGFEALKTKELTTVVCMSGPAMLPTLNKLHEKDGVVDRLLMRCLPRRMGKNWIYTGDVVAFKPPVGVDGKVLVRRVAAVEGEQMVSDDPEDEDFRLANGTCWVLADNEELKATVAKDSRTFGPLPLENVLGRILYYARSQTEHGPVGNSSTAELKDLAVLEAELDVEKLAQTPC